MTRSDIRVAAQHGSSSAGFIHGVLVRLGDVLFRHRTYIFPLTFIVIAALSAPRAPLGSEAWDLALDALGFAVALTGQALRAAVIGLVYIKRGGKNNKIYAEKLVQEGFFAHSRNPLYLGNMLVFFGLFIMLNSILGYLVGVPLFYLAYLAITLAEESFLGKQFGEVHEDYRRRVNRFIPSFSGLGTTMRSMTFNWRRLIRKEYGATFTWMSAALGVFLYESVARHGFRASIPRVRVVVLAWITLLAGYALARFLKKSRRLSWG